MQISVGKIPNFITARSPKGLRRLMLQTQLKLGYGVQFFDIQFSSGKWFAWYYDGQNVDMNNVKEKLDGANS